MVVVLCNCPRSASPNIASTLIHERLAACVNVIPGVTSYYEWDGNLQIDGEETLLIKTAIEQVDSLKARILAIHPYTLPEILVLPVDVARSHAGYVEWVRARAVG